MTFFSEAKVFVHNVEAVKKSHQCFTNKQCANKILFYKFQNNFGEQKTKH